MEAGQQLSQKKYETITASARIELGDFTARRIPHMKKNLVALAELEQKHARVCQFKSTTVNQFSYPYLLNIFLVVFSFITHFLCFQP